MKSARDLPNQPARGRRATCAAAALAVALAAGGCVTGDSSRENKLAAGTLVGLGAGALFGYELIGSGATGPWIAAMVFGAAGAAGGYAVTDRLTRWDRQEMETTAYRSLSEAPAGETARWRNPDTGTNGTITPLRSYLDGQGRICRDYRATVTLRGETYDDRETACRNAVGAWVVG